MNTQHKPWQKLSGVLLALVLLLALVTPAAAADTLPAEGRQISGFTVTERGTESLIHDAPTVTFRHDKSGATVYLIAADDINCTFDISFRTPALDDKGLPHVFEHISISGSKKYPTPNLLFAITNQTYNTFVNAMTNTTFTTFPLSSLSSDQLLALTDYYLDGLFNPMIYTEENLYRREAWRYELADADAPITLSGTVYNEMRGTQNIQNAAYFNTLHTLFPNSILGNNSGGDPHHIPEMQWQDLLDFHTAYYHPANSLTVLYGNLDYAKFLAKLDEYFKAYEAQEISVESGVIAPLTSLQEKTYSYPVEANSPAENASIIDYALVANGASDEELTGLTILTTILNHSASPLMAAIEQAFPNIVFSIGLDTQIPQPYVLFEAGNLNEADKGLFRSTIDKTLAEMAKGLDTDMVEAVLARTELSTYTLTESADVGLSFAVGIAQDWSMHGSLDYYNRLAASLTAIKSKAQNGYFEGLIQKYLLGNGHSALVVTAPNPGGAEAEASALASQLAAYKASLSPEQITELVKTSAEISAWSSQEPPKDLLKPFQVVGVDDLPLALPSYEIKEKTDDGLQIITGQAKNENIGYTMLFLDASDIPAEDLHYYQLYVSLLGSLNTASHEQDALYTLITRYLNGFSAASAVLENSDGSSRPILSVSWLSLNGEYQTGLDLVRDILFNSNLNNPEAILSAIRYNQSTLRTTYNTDLRNALIYRCLAIHNDVYAYVDYLNGLEYYKFLSAAEQELTTAPEAFIDKLQGVATKLRNRNQAAVLFTGSAAAIADFDAQIGSLFTGLPNTERTVADYSSLPRPRNNEALVSDITVQSNLIGVSLADLGIENNAKLTVLTTILDDLYLTPQIRHSLGAYGVAPFQIDDNLIIISYRDPGIAETFKVYDGMADFIRTAQLSQEDVDRYIISSYSNTIVPTGDLNDTSTAVYNKLIGLTQEQQLQELKDLKSVTVSDFRAFGDALSKLDQSAIRMTAGSAAMVEQNAARFETIIYVNKIAAPTGAATTSATLSRGQLISLLYGGAENALDQALADGVITGQSEAELRLDDIVTREEAATILFRWLQLTPAASAQLTDGAAIHTWARQAAATMVALDIMQLDENGAFNPLAPFTTDDLAAALAALATLVENSPAADKAA